MGLNSFPCILKKVILNNNDIFSAKMIHLEGELIKLGYNNTEIVYRT